MSDFRTDFLPLPSGLLVPPGFQRDDEREREARRVAMDQRFFAAESKTGKQFSYLSQSQTTGVGGAAEKPRDTLSFAALRRLYDTSIIDKLIVLARKHQMRYVSRKALVPERETGWRVVHVRSADPTWRNTPEIERRCREVEDIIQKINTRIVPGGFRGWLQMCVEDELVYDRKVIVVARDAQGLPAAYWPIDPTSVKPRLEVLAPFMAVNAERNFQAAAERMSYNLARQGMRDGNGKLIDLTTAAYVQEIDGQIVGAWTDDEIAVQITNPCNQIDHALYGKSIFEESTEWTDGFVSAWTYNNGWFKSKLPEHIAFFGGDYSPEGFDAFQKQLLGTGSGGNRDLMHRLAIVTGAKDFKMDVQALRASMQDMAFPAWIRLLIAGKAGCYRMDPRIINFDVATGNDVNMWKTSSRETQLTLSEEQGFHTLAHNVEDFINTVLVHPRYDDLVFRFVGLERPSEPDRAALTAQKGAWMSVNEQRNESGTLTPIELPGYPGIADIPPSLVPIMQYFDQRQQLEDQAQQAQQAQAYGQSGRGGMVPEDADDSQNPASAQSAPTPSQPPATQQHVLAGAGGKAQSAGVSKSLRQVSQLRRRKQYATLAADED